MKNQISVCVENLRGNYIENLTWINLPCDNDYIKRGLEQIGIGVNTEYEITDSIGINTDGWDDIYYLNDRVKVLVELSEKTGVSTSILDDIMVAHALTWEDKIENAIFIQTNEDGYENLSNDEEIIGNFLVDNNPKMKHILEDNNIEMYFDFEAYGRDMIINYYEVFEDIRNDKLILVPKNY